MRLPLGSDMERVRGFSGDRSHDGRAARYIEELVADSRFAARTFRRTPSLSLAAAFILAIGIGSTTTMFSVANTLLLRRLPLPNGDRIMLVGVARLGGGRDGAFYSDYVEWRARQRSFDELSAYAPTNVTVVSRAAIRAVGAYVS